VKGHLIRQTGGSVLSGRKGSHAVLPIDLGPIGPRATAIDTLRFALDDPTLELVYRRSATGSWIDRRGLPAPEPAADCTRAATRLGRDGDWVAALLHDPALLDDPARLRAAGVAAATAIDDERLVAELRAQLRDEQASRTRILQAGDRKRRRVERNLHDGAQQRLVGLALTLRLAGRRAAGDPAVKELLAEAADELDDAIEELRALARGLHPAIVNDAGLAGALETLAESPGIPVELSIDVPGRLVDTVEFCAYYLVAESVANANKHSGAVRIEVRARVVDDRLEVIVADDGCGGAAASPGSGLEGLADRVGALGGELVIDSDPAQGTTVTAHLPLRDGSAVPHHLVDEILLRVVHPETGSGPGDGRAGRRLRGDTDRRLRALKWIAWQNHAVPGEILEAQSAEEDFDHAKALLLCAGGNRRISESTRNWILGYLTAAGHPESVIAAARVYDDRDAIGDIMNRPRMAMIRAGVVYDALRACAADGTAPTPDALDPVLRAADAIGIPRELVADLQEIVMAEHALRRRRHALVVAPTLPRSLHTSIADAGADA
jgi:signal transduction histidine kinase